MGQRQLRIFKKDQSLEGVDRKQSRRRAVHTIAAEWNQLAHIHMVIWLWLCQDMILSIHQQGLFLPPLLPLQRTANAFPTLTNAKHTIFSQDLPQISTACAPQTWTHASHFQELHPLLVSRKTHDQMCKRQWFNVPTSKQLESDKDKEKKVLTLRLSLVFTLNQPLTKSHAICMTRASILQSNSMMLRLKLLWHCQACVYAAHLNQKKSELPMKESWAGIVVSAERALISNSFLFHTIKVPTIPRLETMRIKW